MPVSDGKLSFWIPDSASFEVPETENVPEFEPFGL